MRNAIKNEKKTSLNQRSLLFFRIEHIFLFFFLCLTTSGYTFGTSSSEGRFTSPKSTTFIINQPTTFEITLKGNTDVPYIESGVLPQGVVFNPGEFGLTNATLSGTIHSGDQGTYKLTFACKGCRSQHFTIIADTSCQNCCIFTTGDHATFIAGETNTYTVNTTNSNSPITLLSGTLPQGIGLYTASSNYNTATLEGIPATNSSSPYTFTLACNQNCN